MEPPHSFFFFLDTIHYHLEAAVEHKGLEDLWTKKHGVERSDFAEEAWLI